MQRASDASDAQKHMMGLSKARLFACMGIPDKKAHEDDIEIWSYKSGNNHRETSRVSNRYTGKKYFDDDEFIDSLTSSITLSDSVSESRYCTVQVVMTNGVVEAVHYNGPTGGLLTEDEQCAYAVRNCVKE